MEFATTLYALLAAGAGLAATEAAKALGKSAVTDAYAAVRTRLTDALGAKSVALIDDAAGNPAYEGLIKADLAKPDIAADAELRQLARTLESAIEALPDAAKAPYAVRIREIRAGRDLLFEDVEGVQADTATSEGDMTFKSVTSPGKS